MYLFPFQGINGEGPRGEAGLESASTPSGTSQWRSAKTEYETQSLMTQYPKCLGFNGNHSPYRETEKSQLE